MNAMNMRPGAFPMMMNSMMPPVMANPIMPMIPTNETTLYVGNLSPYMEESRLLTFFQPFGQVTSCKIMRDMYTYDSRRFGFVSYATVQEAQRAKKELNYQNVDGFEIRIFFKRSPSDFKPEANVFIKNIPKGITTRQLEELCQEFGTIASCSIRNDEKGITLGYGYVQYEEEESARKAVEGLNDKEHWGEKLAVSKFVASKNRANEKKNLYIKSFPKTWNKEKVEQQLPELFGKFGAITCSGVYEFKATEDNALPYAFVAYENDEDAKKAIEAYNGKFIESEPHEEGEEPLFVDYVVPKRFRKNHAQKEAVNYQNNTNLFFKSLKADVSKETLTKVFEKYGKLTSLVLKSCKPPFLNGEELQFAFINFAKGDDANTAIIKAKHDPEILELVHPAHHKTMDFLFYHQSKAIRVQYIRMKKRMQQSLALSSMFAMPQMRQNFGGRRGRGGRFQHQHHHQGPMQFMTPGSDSYPFPVLPTEMPLISNLQLQSPSTYNNSTPSSSSRPNEKKEAYNVDWLKKNKKEFLNFDKDKQSNILGNLMYARILNSGLTEKSIIPKITGMLIDLDILEYEEIIDILMSDSSLQERINEAVEVINENE